MERLLQHYVRRQAEQRPEATALVFGTESLTYGELERQSDQLAALLRESGCQPGDRIGLLLPKSVPAILGMIGILKAGCVYVPMDTASPVSRLVRILESCESRFVLAMEATARLLGEIAGAEALQGKLRVGWMGQGGETGCGLAAEFTRDDVVSQAAPPTDCPAREGDAAHILFTSGSTGVPKGVVITHSNVRHFVEWAVRYFGTQPGDRISGHPPLHFDLSTFDIYGTFAAGAQLHLVAPEMSLLPHKLAEFIRVSELTQWFSVPTVLNLMAKFDVVRPNDFPALKRLLWCGEKFPTPPLIYWMTRLPQVSFTNLYGPTEATIASSYYRVPELPADEKQEIPIGTACDGEELLVLDEHLRPTAPGEVGDLYIAGVGLSPGYWRDPEKTSAAFLPRPGGSGPDDRIYKTGDLARLGSDGLVYLLGRADSQVKVRGYRIEIGEIEAALNAMEGLREGAVVAVDTGGFEGNVLCCAYVPAPGAPITPLSIKKHLGQVLPGYMVPTRWMTLGTLPLNANGKIDRRRLKEDFRAQEAGAGAARVAV